MAAVTSLTVITQNVFVPTEEAGCKLSSLLIYWAHRFIAHSFNIFHKDFSNSCSVSSILFCTGDALMEKQKYPLKGHPGGGFSVFPCEGAPGKMASSPGSVGQQSITCFLALWHTPHLPLSLWLQNFRINREFNFTSLRVIGKLESSSTGGGKGCSHGE